MLISDTKTYDVVKNFNLRMLVEDTMSYLRKHKKIEEVQYFKIDNGYLIQAKDPGVTFKKLLGLGKAIQFELTLSGDQLTSRVGYGDYIKSGVGTAIRTVVFAPFGIPALYGWAKQLLLISDVDKYIKKYVENTKKYYLKANQN